MSFVDIKKAFDRVAKKAIDGATRKIYQNCKSGDESLSRNKDESSKRILVI